MWQQLFKLREGLNSETWTILILKHFSELARVSNNSHERAALLKQSAPNRVLIAAVLFFLVSIVLLACNFNQY